MDSLLRDGAPHTLRPSLLHQSAACSSVGQTVDMHHDRDANIDEGFSEEARSLSGSEMFGSPVLLADASDEQLLQTLLARSDRSRCDFAKFLVHSLRNADKEDIRALIEDLTHFDPTAYFPREIILQILSYLAPKDLLNVSLVSRNWRILSQDERLWRCCFAREGWQLDAARIRAFENLAETSAQRIAPDFLRRKGRLQRKEARKRKTEEAFSDADPVPHTRSESTPPEVPEIFDDGRDAMQGVELAPSIDTVSHMVLDNGGAAGNVLATASPTRRLSLASTRSNDLIRSQNAMTTLKVRPTMFQDEAGDCPRLSWSYLYKQRRRLEHNWDNGLYTMFQIPHPDFPGEGHDECVYTIQHTSRYLVSGSRDKTIRVWDLDTYRLRGRPLYGHEASVLCLQFDERPEHDIIVSGGSDSYVIIWRFSTGEMIKKMSSAHVEPVLNLRFDDRYIVTCSKDKAIKIWSRHAMARNDSRIPVHARKKFAEPGAGGDGDMIKEFTELASLTGHHAAVNAVMLHENTIVSASGDRTIRRWDINTGQLVRTYATHHKGIACVQYDGRRIVSGSSDNTVRIYDVDRAAEIACLNGHKDLVRTVQARFGDLETTSLEELKREAEAADRAYFKSISGGRSGAPSSTTAAPSAAGPVRRPIRSGGSGRSNDYQTTGARIPPGGGGSPWAKIVSGSYDETVILWKRDHSGKWQVKHRLHQENLTRTSRPRRQPLVGVAPANTPVVPTAQTVTAPNAPQTQQQQQLPTSASLPTSSNNSTADVIRNATHALIARPDGNATDNSVIDALLSAHSAAMSRAASQPVQAMTSRATAGSASTAHAHGVSVHPSLGSVHAPPARVAAPSAASIVSATNHTMQQQQQQQPQHTAATVAQHHQQSQSTINHHINHQQPQIHPALAQQQPQNQANVQQQTQANLPTHGQAHPNAQPVGPQHTQAAGLHAAQAHAQQRQQQHRESNRVFKLQFDARRLLCCSQNKIIVGWDFANGDKELEQIGDWSVETS